jgi:tetratricopeptide (TPR) repeat protein
MRRSAALPLLALAVLCAAVFLPVLGHEFVNVDDGDYITNNPHVREGLTLRGAAWALASFHAANWHPVTWISHQLDATLFGLAPGGHHLVSLLLHTANAGLVFLLLDALTGARWASFAVAALFAVHPLHVESVAWAAERKDVLSTFFGCAAVWAYRRHAGGRSRGGYPLLLLFFALGLMAKPMLVTLPLALLVLDFWPLGRLHPPAGAAGGRRAIAPLLLEKLPLLALAGVSGVLTVLAQASYGAVASREYLPLPLRLGNAAAAGVGYLRKAAWPSGLTFFYPHPGRLPAGTVAAAAGVVAGITLLVVVLARRRPYLTAGWLWYLITLLPVIGLVQVGEQAMADRYAYVPLLGIFTAVVWGAAGIARGRRGPAAALLLAGALLVSSFAAAAARQVHSWRTGRTLLEHALAIYPEAWWAHNNLGNILVGEGKLREAAAHYDRAIRARPGYARAHNNFGRVLLDEGKAPAAIRKFREALGLMPDLAEAHANLGLALAEEGQFEEAVPHYRQALTATPGDAVTLTNLGNALAALGRIPEAEASLREAVANAPGLPDARFNLGNLLAGKGDYAGAAVAFAEAVRLNPGYAEAENNLGAALMMLGRSAEAAAHFTAALRLKPDHASARTNLERLRARQ